MRLKFAAFSILKPMLFRLSRMHWRNPLLQTWSLVGGLLIVGMGAHYGRHVMPGEKNKFLTATGWLRSDMEAASAWRPAVVFTDAAASLPERPPPIELNLRACANRAADEPGWKFLSAEIRKRLTALPACAQTITVTWSGTSGGDAAALDLYYSGTRGLSGGTPYDFVIGNGRRGRDGGIEVTRRWREINPESQPIAICLLGESSSDQPTIAQEAALGELIAGIEARSGSVNLAMLQSRDQGLLADAE